MIGKRIPSEKINCVIEAAPIRIANKSDACKTVRESAKASAIIIVRIEGGTKVFPMNAHSRTTRADTTKMKELFACNTVSLFVSVLTFFQKREFVVFKIVAIAKNR